MDGSTSVRVLPTVLNLELGAVVNRTFGDTFSDKVYLDGKA